jgi:hypothetical protein
MRKDQIPEFVEAILDTGCLVRVVGHKRYLFTRPDVPDGEFDHICRSVHKICNAYGDRDHLRPHIVAHLYRIAKFRDIEGMSIH